MNIWYANTQISLRSICQVPLEKKAAGGSIRLQVEDNMLYVIPLLMHCFTKRSSRKVNRRHYGCLGWSENKDVMRPIS